MPINATRNATHRIQWQRAVRFNYWQPAAAAGRAAEMSRKWLVIAFIACDGRARMGAAA